MKILFVNHNENTLFAFRKELLDKLILDKHEVLLCIENTKRIQEEYGSKVRIIDVPMNLKSISVFSNVKIKKIYNEIIKSEKPDLILSFGIKPNIYCGELSKDIPIIANITGLGSIFSKNFFIKSIGLHLYKKSFENVDYVFFQNQASYDFFKKHRIPINRYRMIPGSGVNTERFNSKDDEIINDGVVRFLFASRAIREKGIGLLLEAIPSVVQKNENVHFTFLQNEENVLNYPNAFETLRKYSKYITLLNRVKEMPAVYINNHFLVSPSFYKEGISNVLLESLSCKRPIITTIDNPGCMEIIKDGINGYGIKSNDLKSLIDALIKASKTPISDILEMGKNGRVFVQEKFNRETTNNIYLETIDMIRKERYKNER